MELDTRLTERLYHQYMAFFDDAEENRRWNPLRAVDWDKMRDKPSEDIAVITETFCAVESFLPDYVTKGLNLVRKSFGQAWFAANWAYEESKHSVILMEYLIRTGARTPEQVFDFQNKLRDVEWQIPFDTARRMTVYGCLQEMATFVIYMRQAERAQTEGLETLRQVFRLVGKDEIAHTRFYQDVIKVCLEEDREGTLDDIAFVFANFRMPGVGIVPGYDARVEIMRQAGVDRTVFIQKIYLPVLKYLGVGRRELTGRMTKAKKAAAAAAAATVQAS